MLYSFAIINPALVIWEKAYVGMQIFNTNLKIFHLGLRYLLTQGYAIVVMVLLRDKLILIIKLKALKFVYFKNMNIALKTLRLCHRTLSI